MPSISVDNFFKINESRNNLLRIIRLNGKTGSGNVINSYEVNRPGMALLDYFDYFAFDRIQVFGNGEASYIKKLEGSSDTSVLEKFFQYKIPVCIFSNSVIPPKIFLDIADKNNVAVFSSELRSSLLIRRIFLTLEYEFAQVNKMHGTFIEVYGVGILLRGKSGVGKSEATLELISRGHRLVCDDSVTLKKINDYKIVAETHPILKHYMEVRGLGIIDIAMMSGMNSVESRKKLELIIDLEHAKEDEPYDRMGLDDEFETIMDVRIPHIRIPVVVGRNISILIETAAKNYRMKKMGYHSAREFNETMIKSMSDNR